MAYYESSEPLDINIIVTWLTNYTLEVDHYNEA